MAVKSTRFGFNLPSSGDYHSLSKDVVGNWQTVDTNVLISKVVTTLPSSPDSETMYFVKSNDTVRLFLGDTQICDMDTIDELISNAESAAENAQEAAEYIRNAFGITDLLSDMEYTQGKQVKETGTDEFTDENYNYVNDLNDTGSPYTTLSDVIDIKNGKYRLTADHNLTGDVFIKIYNPLVGYYSNSITIQMEQADDKYIFDFEISTNYAHNYVRIYAAKPTSAWMYYNAAIFKSVDIEQIFQNADDISDLQGTVSTNTAAIESAQSDLADAVEDIDEVKSSIANANAEISNLSDTKIDKPYTYTVVSGEETLGYFRNGTFTTNSAWRWVSAEVTEGEKYRITASGNGYVFAYYFCDDNNTVLGHSPTVGTNEYTEYIDIVIIIPENCTRLYVNCNFAKAGHTIEHGKVESISYENIDLGEIAENVDTMLDDISDIKDNVQNSNQKKLFDIQNGRITHVLSINHRGYNIVAPENTLPAYRLSSTMGFNYVETDVSFTADSIPVLLHDETINRTARNVDGTEIANTINISDITYEQALQYDFGIWKSQTYAGTKIPTFEQFIALCHNLGLHPYVEIKNTATYTAAQIRNLVDIVNAKGMKSKVTWISFSMTYLQYVVDYDQAARVGYLISWVDDTMLSRAKSLRTGYNETFLSQSVFNVSDTQCRACADENIPLEVWATAIAENQIENERSLINNLNSYISGATTNKFIAGREIYNANIEVSE